MHTIFDRLQDYHDAPALITEHGTIIKYNELINNADIFAGKIGRRCLLFILCRNCSESIAGYVGALRNHIVPLLLSDTIEKKLLEGLVENYHPQYVYMPNERAHETPGTVILQYDKYTLLKMKYEEDQQLNPELALLLTTSGSTGSPKLVRQSYKNIQANTESIVEYLQITEKDRAITTLPMSYTYGLSILNTHLYTGASVYLSTASVMEQVFWEALKKEHITTFGGVPFMYEMLKRFNFEKRETPALRYITQAGGKLPKEMASDFIAVCTKKNIEFIVMYGQTEATARMSYLPWKAAGSKTASIGIAIPGGKFWLADDDGTVIQGSEAQAGELIYQGDNVTLGYAESRYDLARGDDNGGILKTGDIAERDTDGFYYIVGRKKRFLKIFGSRINLDEVENLLKKEGIDCVCDGVDDHLTIYITDESLKEKTVEYIRDHTDINRNGFMALVINEIPRNESGKVLYSNLPK
jgi:acyl-CoA synthetase (AMP-forming)/AMP-acid ligase II